MIANNRWAAVCRRGADVLGPQTPQGARLHVAWRFFARREHDLLVAGRAAGFTRSDSPDPGLTPRDPGSRWRAMSTYPP